MPLRLRLSRKSFTNLNAKNVIVKNFVAHTYNKKPELIFLLTLYFNGLT